MLRHAAVALVRGKSGPIRRSLPKRLAPARRSRRRSRPSHPWLRPSTEPCDPRRDGESSSRPGQRRCHPGRRHSRSCLPLPDPRLSDHHGWDREAPRRDRPAVPQARRARHFRCRSFEERSRNTDAREKAKSSQSSRSRGCCCRVSATRVCVGSPGEQRRAMPDSNPTENIPPKHDPVDAPDAEDEADMRERVLEGGQDAGDGDGDMRKCAASSGSKRTATSHSHAAARRARRGPPEWMRGRHGAGSFGFAG